MGWAGFLYLYSWYPASSSRTVWHGLATVVNSMRESIHAIRCDFLCLQDTQSKDSIVEDLHELHDSVVEEPVCEGWVLDDSLGSGSPGVRPGVSGRMSLASSGHWRSAALWMKKTVGRSRPSVSTRESRRLIWRCQYCLVCGWRSWIYADPLTAALPPAPSLRGQQ